MERPDGYKGLAATYGLRFAAPPRIMDLGLLARALKDHQIDVAPATPPRAYRRARPFRPRRRQTLFPALRSSSRVSPSDTRAASGKQALDDLAGKISDADMRQLNYEVDGQKRDVKEVVREFLRQQRVGQNRAPPSLSC